jgi:2-polyprenyl-3-methyl-5-hydroxy-6-metoxy-1,4-benzoquinol methylase
VKCNQEKLVRKSFLLYDYHYEIKCKSCDVFVPALDYAEFVGSHPFQIGDLWPEKPVNVWLPVNTETDKQPTNDNWGSQRIKKLFVKEVFTKLDSLDEFNPKTVWDANSDAWAGSWPDGGDFNHKHLIIPEVLRFLNPQEGENILDLACGEGNLARILANMECRITGIDISNMLDYAIKKEQADPLNISYKKFDAREIFNEFGANSFDKIVCNMAIMDMENHKQLFKSIAACLKPNGIFVFSITHPCFAWPVTNTLRLPKDSQRNEDKIWLVDNYFDNRPTTVSIEDFPSPFLYFPRTISDYVNSLIKSGLQIQEISEPQVDENLVNTFPRHAFRDLDRIPDFMIVKTQKISK